MPNQDEKVLFHQNALHAEHPTKKMERMLDLLHDVENAVNLGIWDYHINTGVLNFNRQFAELFDYTAADAYENFDFLINNIINEDIPNTLKALNDHITGRTPFFKAEFRIKTSNGKYKWLQQQGKVTEKDELGSATRMVGILSDITELKKSFQQLSKSEAQVKAFLKIIPDNIFILNRKGVIIDAYLNESKSNRLSLETMIDKRFSEVFNKNMEAEFDYVFSNAIEKKTIQNFEFSVEEKKEIYYYECRLLYADSKNILAIVRDITSEKVASEALLQSEAELKKLNQTKDRLFSIIGHDLKSPFNNILGFADLLTENFDNLSPEKIKEYLSYIRISTGQAFALFENLLEWSRAQSSKIHPYPNILDFNKLVEKNIALLAAQIKQKEIVLENQLNTDTVLNVDPNMVSTVFRNILSNAIKFSRQGGLITISKITEHDHIKIGIRDNGIGMPEEIREKLFKINENISRKGTSGEKGTGLGLLLCKDFMEKNNGEIECSSKEGNGTTFYLKFRKPHDI